MENPEIIWSGLEKKLRNFILSKVHDRAIANDILQEVFIRIHTRTGTVRDAEKNNSCELRSHKTLHPNE